MSSPLRARLEIRKLAAALHVDDSELVYLTKVPVEDIRTLRQQVSDRLFGDDVGALRRVAQAASVLPAPVVATIGQRSFGPMLCARVTAHLDTRRAVDLAGRFEPRFLADLAAELDPRRAADVVAKLSPKLVAAVAAELVRNEDHVTLGRFMGYVSADALATVIEAFDDTTLLRATAFAEPTERLDEVIAGLSDERLASLVRTATSTDTAAELLALAGEVSDEQRARVVSVATTLDDDVLDAMIAVADDEDLWDALVPLVEHMDDDMRALVRERAESLGALDRVARLAELLR